MTGKSVGQRPVEVRLTHDRRLLRLSWPRKRMAGCSGSSSWTSALWVCRVLVGDDGGELVVDGLDELADLLGDGPAEVCELVLDVRWDRGKLGAREESVRLKTLQGLGEHPVTDARHGSADLGEPQRAVDQRGKHE